MADGLQNQRCQQSSSWWGQIQHSQKLDVLMWHTKPFSPSHQQMRLCQHSHFITMTPDSMILTNNLSTPQCLCGVVCSLHASPVHVTQALENQPIPHPSPPAIQCSAPTESMHMATSPTHTVNNVVHVLDPIPTISSFETLTWYLWSTTVRLTWSCNSHLAWLHLTLPLIWSCLSPQHSVIQWTCPLISIQHSHPVTAIGHQFSPWSSSQLSCGNKRASATIWMSSFYGTLIEGVGRKPPLQLVDKEWGSQKHQHTSKDSLAPGVTIVIAVPILR